MLCFVVHGINSDKMILKTKSIFLFKGDICGIFVTSNTVYGIKTGKARF